MRLLLAISVVACVGSLAFAVYAAWSSTDQSARVDQVAAETHDALCAFKLDLAGRAVATAAFLTDLRDGARPPIPGITLGDLERSLDGQQATLDSLKSLDCNERSTP